MLRDLLGFELRLHTRQIAFWVTLVILAVVGLVAASADFLTVGAEGGQKIKINGAYVITQFVATISVLTVFFGAVFTVTGMLRDDTHKALEVIHATPVTTRDMILSRMIAVWLVTFLCASAAAVGYMFGQFMPWAPEDAYGPFNALYYLHPILLFIGVNSLLVVSIFTAIAVTTRNRAIVYVSAVGILIVSLAIDGILTSQAPTWARALLEPFGSGAYVVETEFWSASERNAQLVGLNTWLGGNRLLMTGLSLIIFGVAFALSRRGIVNRGRTRKAKVEARPAVPRRVAAHTPSLGLGHAFATVARRSRFEFANTVRSTAMIILLSLAAMIFVANVVLGDQFNPNPTLKTSSFLVQLALGSFGLSMVIVMIFFGSDIVWRDRQAKMHEIIDATPVSNSALLLGKWGALGLLLLSMVGVGLVLAMGAQLIIGDTVPVPRTYVALAILSFFIGFFFQGMLVMFIQNFMPGRVIGMFVAAGVLIGLAVVLPQLPFFHPLMSFGPGGPGSYSEMAGYQGFRSWTFQMAYWGAFVVLLGVLSLWLWRRGNDIGLMQRLRAVPKRIGLPSGALAGVSLATFIGLGVAGYQSYSADEWVNSDTREKQAAEFETLVIDSFDRPSPRVIAASVDADLRPSDRSGTFTGTITFDNPFDAPIARAFVSTRVDKEDADIAIAGARRVTGETLADTLWEEYDVADYAFEPPLAPGEQREMTFTVRYTPPTITAGSAVRSNGTFINNQAAMPVFGNLNAAFLTNPDKRKKYDLGERELWPEREDEDARRYQLLSTFSGYNDYVDFDARVCTDPGQVPVAPGKFVRAFERDGQHCREYRAINPIHYFFSFVSADYEVRKQVWSGDNGQDIDLEIYFHPEHDWNVDLMFTAMEQAFDTYTKTFGPYQYAQLRIMEFPYASFAQAFAGTVPFSENIGFVQDPGQAEDAKTLDYASYVTMHEIGHMWFAHQVVGAFAQGSNLLSEGLTENATMLAYEDMYDFEKARRFHEVRATRGYLTGRTVDADKEPVLAKAEGQGYLNYQKTSWVMWGMRGIMGNEPVQTAVRRFLTEHAATKGAPYPTTLELLDMFREEIDPDYHGLIEDYWNAITFWDLKVEGEPAVTPLGADRFEITLTVATDKSYANEEDGEMTSVFDEGGSGVLDEFVLIGVYDEDPKDSLGAKPVHTEMIRVSAAEQTVTLNVTGRPTHIVLDPHRYLIERNVTDNVVELPASGDASEAG